MQQIAKGKFYQFWIASSPFFESSLFIAAALRRNNPDDPQPNNGPQSDKSSPTFSVKISFTDADGDMVNETVNEFPRDSVGTLELSQFMEPFKYEGGLKHGVVTIESEETIGVVCRMHAQASSSLMGTLAKPDSNYRAFFPVRIGEGRKSMLALVNLGKDSNSIKCKLFLGKRNPEIICDIPAGGSRLLSLESEFSDYVDFGTVAGPSSSVMGYIRVTPRKDVPFAAQVLERMEGKKDEGIFATLT